LNLDQIYQQGLGNSHEAGLQAVFDAGQASGVAAAQVVSKAARNQANLDAIAKVADAITKVAAPALAVSTSTA
jgi:hypothetical protein